MNILFIINGMRFGGMERQLVEIIRALAGTDYRICLAVLNKQGPMAEFVEPHLAAPIFYLDRRKTHFALTLRRLRHITREQKISLVYVQDTFSSLYAIPVCKTDHLKLINGSIRHAGVSEGFTYLFEKRLLALANVVISNSQAGLDFYGIKGQVLYNFIDLSRFKKTHAPLTRVVMNANFSNYKDHLTLLFAAKRLLEDGVLTLLGLIGDGPLRERCQKLCSSMGIADRVVFHGHVQNVEELLLDYGVGVLCSTLRFQEGISNSVLEYMGAGLIAIASKVGAIPEIICDGVNGMLFEAENVDSLYAVLARVAKGVIDADAMRSNALKTLKRQFDPDTNCRKLIDIIETA